MAEPPFGRVRLIEMVVESVRVHMLSSQHVVILKQSERDRYLPIWIGPSEANAIAMRLQGLNAERPLTHDLLVSVVAALNSSISRVVVTAHYPTDVLAGALVGAVGAMMVRRYFALRRLGFSIGPGGDVHQLPGPSLRRIKAVARGLLAP